MLPLSGIVRPSHVELRYAIPFLNIEGQSNAFQEKPVTAIRPSRLLQKFFELMTCPTQDDGSLGQYLPSNNRPRLRKSVLTSIRLTSVFVQVMRRLVHAPVRGTNARPHRKTDLEIECSI